MLRVCDNPEEISGPGILGVDQRRKQVTLIDPGGMSGVPNGITSEERRVGFAPKMFAFDGIFDQTDDQVSFFFFLFFFIIISCLSSLKLCVLSWQYLMPTNAHDTFITSYHLQNFYQTKPSNTYRYHEFNITKNYMESAETIII